MRLLRSTFWCCLIAVTSSSAAAQTIVQPNAPSQALPAIYQNWLSEDVHWIVTPEELAQFTRLSSNGDRDAFVVQFWLRHNPTPDTEECGEYLLQMPESK